MQTMQTDQMLQGTCDVMLAPVLASPTLHITVAWQCTTLHALCVTARTSGAAKHVWDHRPAVTVCLGQAALQSCKPFAGVCRVLLPLYTAASWFA